MIRERRLFFRATAGLTACVASGGRLVRRAVADERETRVFELALREGRVADATIRVTEGEKIELRRTSDAPVELHLHGYDIELAVKPGEPATMAFETFATGRFPPEGHGKGAGSSHTPLPSLEVYPR